MDNEQHLTMPQSGSTAADTAAVRITAETSAHASLSASRGPLPTDSDHDDGLPDVARYEGPQVPSSVPGNTFGRGPSVGFQGGDEGAPKYGVGGRQQYDADYNPPGADLNPQGSLIDSSVADDVRAARG